MSSTEVPVTEDEGATGQADQLEHPTMAERAARGEAARTLVPLSVHGEWQSSSDRPDPVRLLEEQGVSRVPELVPIRYGRMLVSPFTFYRGAAYLMASDLASAPRTGYLGKSDGFDRAMARIAETYADQNERDYATLKLAVDSGKVAAESA